MLLFNNYFHKKISLKQLVKLGKTQNRKQKNLQNALNKFSPTVRILVREPFNCYDYFLRLSGFHDLLENAFLINLKFC